MALQRFDLRRDRDCISRPASACVPDDAMARWIYCWVWRLRAGRLSPAYSAGAQELHQDAQRLELSRSGSGDRLPFRVPTPRAQGRSPGCARAPPRRGRCTVRRTSPASARWRRGRRPRRAPDRPSPRSKPTLPKDSIRGAPRLHTTGETACRRPPGLPVGNNEMTGKPLGTRTRERSVRCGAGACPWASRDPLSVKCLCGFAARPSASTRSRQLAARVWTQAAGRAGPAPPPWATSMHAR